MTPTCTSLPNDQSAILTAPEAAALLRLPVSTLYSYGKRGLIPAIKVGKHWLYPKQDLEQWIHERSARNMGGTR